MTEKTFTVTLTARQCTLIRVALLQRLDRLRNREDCKESYNESRQMLIDGPMSIRSLQAHEVLTMGNELWLGHELEGK